MTTLSNSETPRSGTSSRHDLSAPEPLAPGLSAGLLRAHGSHAASARLLIRTGRAARHRGSTDLKALWQRWLGNPLKPRPGLEPAALQVEVAAPSGQRLFVLRDPEGVVELSLGPATYDITVIRGHRRRRYTVPLEPGAVFDLDLNDAAQGP